MKLIDKIEISYFRSFAKTSNVVGCSDLNIFSGKNDSGKSNILKALNLFFSEKKVDFYNDFVFIKDFSKQREEYIGKQLKGKKFIKIRILFNKLMHQGRFLPDQFWVEKVWDKDGRVTRKTKDKSNRPIQTKDQKDVTETLVTTATTIFLKKIHFIYIPAIKSKLFFDHLKGEYQDSLGRAIDIKSNVNRNDKKTLEDWTKVLNTGNIREILDNKINSDADEMLKEFKQSAPEISESSLSIPNLDFSKVLEVQTEKNIPLDHRGDGIQAKFIPHILDEISKNNKSQLVVWGFEEPENSFEYGNAQKSAEFFQEKYCKNKQIFITSHSFNFITLSGTDVSQYRVWKKSEKKTEGDDNSNSSSHVIHLGSESEIEKNYDMTNKEKLYEELGVINLSKELKDLWEQKKQEIENVREAIKKYNHGKIYILTEGETDVEFLKILFNIFIDEWEKKYEFTVPNGGAQSLQGFLYQSLKIKLPIKLIAVFDNDKEGIDAYGQISKKYNLNIHPNIQAIILPDLDWARNWEVLNTFSRNNVINNVDLNGKALPIEMYFYKYFENDFDKSEKIFEQGQHITLPDKFKKKMRKKIRELAEKKEIRKEEMIDGEKIVDRIQDLIFD